MNTSERIGCEEALERLAAYLDQELTPQATAEVRRHLEKCRSCYSRAEFERRLKGRIRDEMKIRVLPSGLEERIRGLLRGLPQET